MSFLRLQNLINLNYLVYIIITFFFIYSVFIISYQYDGHHVGLVYSNALDLINGRYPYKEIFIQYGFLTTLIHGLRREGKRYGVATLCIGGGEASAVLVEVLN